MSDIYDFDLDKVIDWILGRKPGKVAVQLPDGLKSRARYILSTIEERTATETVLVADPCYGACDFPADFKRYADVIVQFGHSSIPSLEAPEDVLFVEVMVGLDPLPLLMENIDRLGRTVGLVTTVQHIEYLGVVKEWMESNGIEASIGLGDRRLAHPGQVLGCNVTSATSIVDRVEQFVYIGSGNFHPLAVALETSKPVLVVDPLNVEVRDVEDIADRLLRQRHGAIVLASEALSFAVLVCTKPGQMREDKADSIIRSIRSTGRDAIKVLMDHFDPDDLMAIDVDAYVSTACPRLAIDDYLRYKRPMITPVELEIALGLEDWENYRFDSILG
jgi:2-(3-amino-3-carboxypropyl)histidine synthase